MKEPLAKLGLDWHEWLLIQDGTLRELDKDASGYKDALVKLTDAQTDLNKSIEHVNELQLEKHELQKIGYQKDLALYEAENPPWYKHPAFWAAVSFAGGFAAATGIVLAVNAAKVGGL